MLLLFSSSAGRAFAWLALALGLGCGRSSPATPPSVPTPVSTSAGTNGAARWVNVFVGTAPSSAPDPVRYGAGGSTFPAAALPFGMVQWGPDTPNAMAPGYVYDDRQIIGFSLTHLNGAGCPAMRDFPIVALSGSWDPSTDLSAGFDHGSEIASPGFYEVTLASGIRVDLTATLRTGFARFTFPSGPRGTLLLASSHASDGLLVRDPELRIESDGAVTGKRTNMFFCASSQAYTLYFAARFDRPFDDSGTFDSNSTHAGATLTSQVGGGVYVSFDTTHNVAVNMKVGLSFISAENARANLDAENPGWDFDAVHTAALAQWNDALGHVTVEGGADDDRRALYSALYHVLLQPATASDANGDFTGLDGQRKNDGHVRYVNYSGWDIYRSWVQLVTLIAPDQIDDILRSLVDAGAECGALPRWELANTEASLMIGDSGGVIVANGYAFGARGFDAKAALDMTVRAATDPAAACNGASPRPGLADYLSRHYCPHDAPHAPPGSVSSTLQYATDDFAIAQYAKALGDATTHATFMARAGYWKNVFDPHQSANGTTGYLQPRLAADVGGAPAFVARDVTVQEPDDILGASGFTEVNATQETLAVAHDIPGLIAALGGDGPFIARLDALFTQVNAGLKLPYFYMGNEPGFVSPWAYAFAGAPHKTQAVVRRILHEAFNTKPNGLPGNDDLGTTSAWQAWAVLGMYPAIPGVAGVVLGSPTFPKATLRLRGGADLVITAEGAAPDAPYVQTLVVNGQPSTSSWLDWSRVAGGGTIAFTLGTKPNASFGAAPPDRPPSVR
jgi:predicted alpha-1,2-mannosidase